MTHSHYRIASGILGAALMLTAYATKSQDAPPLTGPSEMSTAIAVAASPDVLSQDGASQSLITITARDANGQLLRNLSLRAEIVIDGLLADFGRLSARNVVTDANGRATLTYTAPFAPAFSEDNGVVVQIFVVPAGTDFANATARYTNIRLVPSGVIIPPSDLEATFTATPRTPTEGESVFFDARLSRGSIASYEWDFGDGATATGPTARHTYPVRGTATTYVVTLIVADAFGRATGVIGEILVTPDTNLPNAIFFTSPGSPRVNQPIHFNATESTPGAGHRIVSYAWNFGDGTVQTTTGPLVDHVYTQAGAYTVALTVTNEVGNTHTVKGNIQPQ